VILEQEEKTFIGFSALTAQLWKKFTFFFSLSCQPISSKTMKTLKKLLPNGFANSGLWSYFVEVNATQTSPIL
jgi:hypothetical protein